MMPIIVDPRTQLNIFDDFHLLDTVATNGTWLSTKGTGGTLALNTTLVGGWLNIPSAATDNDYQVLTTQAKQFQFAAGKPFWCEASLKLTESATNVANFLFGVSSVLTTGLLASDGAGPATTYDGAIWYKVDGSMFLRNQSSAATVQTTNALATAPAFVSGTTYRLGIHFDPGDGTTGFVHFFLNGARVQTNTIALASLGAMYPIFGVKAGSASAETLNVDYVRFVAVR